MTEESSIEGPAGDPPAQGTFANVYADQQRADAYARLEFPGTYYLAFRDLPGIIGPAPPGGTALDFGAGAGRSTRFLRRLGFQVVGVDIAEHMLVRARSADPGGDYRLVSDDDLGGLPERSYDVVLSAFTFDNIPGWEKKQAIFAALGRSLRPGGRIVNLVSTPEIYVHEWASFSTRDFPGNAIAKTGEIVRTIMLDVDDRRPVDDIFWTHDDYLEVYRRCGLTLRAVHRPLGRESDPCTWVTETRVPPWAIYDLTLSFPIPPLQHP